MNLSVRDADGPQKMNAAKDNPEPARGIQKIPNRYLADNGNTYDVGGAYGGGRIRLMETDDNVSVLKSQTTVIIYMGNMMLTTGHMVVFVINRKLYLIISGPGKIKMLEVTFPSQFNKNI